MATTLVVGTVIKTERMPSSVNGNPRFQVTINMHPEQGWKRRWPTAPDAGLAYGIQNPSYRERPHIFALNGRGHIITAHPLDEPGALEYVANQTGLDRDTVATILTVGRAISAGELI